MKGALVVAAMLVGCGYPGDGELAAVPRPEGVVQVFNVLDYGAKCDGLTNDLTAITATITAACAQPGSIVYTPPSANGCLLGQDGANDYSILMPCGDVTFQGARGDTSTWKHMASLPTAPVVMIEIDDKDSITFDGMTFDGNWGNAATTIVEASSNLTLSGTYTLNVVSTAGFPAAPLVINVQSATGGHSAATQNNVVTCSGSTATTFTGCTGGSGIVMRDFAVGYVDGITGINQITQTDPMNFLIFSRGATNLTIQDCNFRDSYGDSVWLGQSFVTHSDATDNVKVIDNTFFMSARVGVSFSASVNNAMIEGNTIMYAHQEAIDAEPASFATRNVSIRNNNLTGWWDTTEVLGTTMHIEEGAGGNALWGQSDTSWTIEHNTINGPTELVGVWNAVFRDNSSICDTNGNGSPPDAFSPLEIEFGGGNLVVDGNYFYTRSPFLAEDFGSTAAISIQNSGEGSDGAGFGIPENPASIVISNNSIDAQNDRFGIFLLAPGTAIANTTGTATAVGLTTVVDTTASWIKNRYLGQIVEIGGAQAVIHDNTACPGTCTLTLDLVNNSSATAWQTPLGEYAPTPTGTAYTIFPPSGQVDIFGNHISLKNTSGFGQGANGIALEPGNLRVAGGRVRIHDNEIRDAGGGAILIDFGAANLTYPLVDVFRNYGFDDQATPTETSVVQFENAPEVTVWTLSDNIAGENVTTLVSGLTSGTWLTHDGTPADWAGFGSPNSVVTAVVGSTYRQLDGTGASITWTKQVGTGNTGWVADALQSTAPTFTGVTLGAQVVSTAAPSASAGTLGTGSTNWVGNITGVGATSTTLAFGGGGFATTSWCTAVPNQATTIELITATRSATAPVFSCFSSTTGLAATCVNFTYTCTGE